MSRCKSEPSVLACRGDARRATDHGYRTSELKVADTYLIFSEVELSYVPAVGKVMSQGRVTLTDVAYTRPRQSACVMYKTTACTPVRVLSDKSQARRAIGVAHRCRK